jgi:hypothetical protein
MDVVKIWNYLEEQYQVVCFKTADIGGLYVTDLVIKVSSSLPNLTHLSSTGCDRDKVISLKKALCEMVERLVIISPYVGPIEFFGDKPFTRSTLDKLVPLEFISPFFSLQKRFSSRGHACHEHAERALSNSIHEYYETTVRDDMFTYLTSSDFQDRKMDLKASETKGIDKDIISKFEVLAIDFNDYCFSIIWHPIHRSVIASSCDIDLPSSATKAFIEAATLFDEFKSGGGNKKSEPPPYLEQLSSGIYQSPLKIEVPCSVKRHSQILSDLDLHVYISIGSPNV